MTNSSESTNTGKSSTQSNSSNSTDSPKPRANQAPAEPISECTTWRKDNGDDIQQK